MTEANEISATEVDRIMNLDPLNLSEQDLDKIIRYQRIQRAQFELGVKPKKEKGSVDLSSVLAALIPAAPEVPKIKRRF